MEDLLVSSMVADGCGLFIKSNESIDSSICIGLKDCLMAFDGFFFSGGVTKEFMDTFDNARFFAKPCFWEAKSEVIVDE